MMYARLYIVFRERYGEVYGVWCYGDKWCCFVAWARLCSLRYCMEWLWSGLEMMGVLYSDRNGVIFIK